MEMYLKRYYYCFLRLCQMGLSGGCVVRPVLQTHCIALTDIICLILAR